MLNAFFVSLFFVLSRSRFVLVTAATSGCDGDQRRFQSYSGEIYKEATLSGSEIYGQPAGDRESRARINLPTSRRERYRLEGNPSRHHARELHQQHRLQLLYRGHNVSTAACSPRPYPPPTITPLPFFGLR